MKARSLPLVEIIILAVLGLDLLLGIIVGAVRAKEPKPTPTVTEFIEQPQEKEDFILEIDKP